MTAIQELGWPVGAFIFVLGLMIGSFLNVCSFRLPRGESVVFPGSHCPNCASAVKWYDNIPLVSFIALGGKCRNCMKKISIRYFFGELLCGLIWLGLWLFYGISAEFFAGIILFSILLTVTFTDFETGLIPDKMTFPGIAAGLVLSTVFPQLQDRDLWYWGLMDSALGVFAGGGILIFTGWLGSIVFKKESMGGGDVKLLALIGAFIGWEKAILVFFFAPLTAILFALYMKYFKKSETIPFGPFLALTGALFFTHGDKVISYLFSTYGV